MDKKVIPCLVLLLLLIPSVAYSELSKDRQKALEILWNAYGKLQQGDSSAIDGVEQALEVDPNLAYANFVRAEYALVSEDWEVAKTYFEKGLKHLHEPDQPLSPSDSAVITAKEIEADARVFLGYTYIELGRKANSQGANQLEKKYLDSAKVNLETGLKLNPGPEARKMAEHLLKMFSS